jgi:hypothetical protein
MLELETTEAIEAAEASIDSFIERRIREAGEQHRVEEEWKASVRKYNAKHREERRTAWLEFHLRQAFAAVSTAAALVAQHREAADRLTNDR